MNYTLEEVYDYILELTDKKGSDLFQLPYVLSVFQSSTLDFIGEKIPSIEKQQQVTQDLQSLMLTSKESVINDLNDPHAVTTAIPSDLHYLARVNPIFKGNVTSKRPRLVRHGNLDAMKSDPHNSPSTEYPIITQFTDTIKIESGYVEKPISVLITYLKKPLYAKLTEPNQRIVNLPDVVIDAIILKTESRLLGSKGDPRYQTAYNDERSFRKEDI